MKRQTARLMTLFLVWMLVLPARMSFAGTSTPGILINTAKALPSCLQYKVKGVCFYLQCKLFFCSVRASIRIEHFVPDAVVSVYHDPLAHPWTDYGSVVNNAISGFGSAMLGVPIDSAGTRTRDDRTSRNRQFRDADAFGHPLGVLNFLLAGDWPSSAGPSVVAVPTPAEMMKFPSTIGNIAAEWGQVPSAISNSVVANASSMADVAKLASQVQSSIAAIPNVISQVSNAGQSLSDAMSTGKDISNALGNIASGGPLPALSSVLGGMSFLGMGFFCPPASQPFGLYFNSHIDALTWRGVLPAELLYPGSWIPGMREIGAFPINTWSGVYPRDGSVIQQHPVKGAAVLAQRVGDIITRRSQPHIYTPMIVDRNSNGFRYFHSSEVRENDPGNTVWQRLYPNAERSCSAFGKNDAVNLTSWGDGNTTSEESYMWSMWRRYECCQKVGQIFLFTVP